MERKNQWNAAAAAAQQPVPEETLGEAGGVVVPAAPLSVAERIHQLEWQSRSVPNLAAGQQQQRSGAPSAAATVLANGANPAAAVMGSTCSSSSSSSSCAAQQDESLSSSSSSAKYTFLDPDKRMKVADPTLKAIQKQALLSYYERHAGRSSTGGQQPPKSPSKVKYALLIALVFIFFFWCRSNGPADGREMFRTPSPMR